LKLLEDAVHAALNHGLAVILDIHPSSDFKHKLAAEERQVEGFADFWRALAADFAHTDPERVFFEVLNEPELSDGYRWYGIQTRLIAAIRHAAPQHTIIATGHGWSAVDDLVALEPFGDRNVIYNFHFYQPAIFTHQGATWGTELWHHLPGVHYPSHPGANADLIAALPQFTQKLQLVRYDQDRWDRQRIEAEIALAGQWAAAHHVRVTCNEFGVYRRYADPEERAAWIRDVRTALEAQGIGWTMWDYAESFAVAPGEPGQRVPDQRVLKALGLR
jgi:endoglucanase